MFIETSAVQERAPLGARCVAPNGARHPQKSGQVYIHLVPMEPNPQADLVYQISRGYTTNTVYRCYTYHAIRAHDRGETEASP